MQRNLATLSKWWLEDGAKRGMQVGTLACETGGYCTSSAVSCSHRSTYRKSQRAVSFPLVMQLQPSHHFIAQAGVEQNGGGKEPALQVGFTFDGHCYK